MSNAIQVDRAFIEPAYRRCENEEGAYDAHVGYHVLAQRVDGPFTHTYIYSSPRGIMVFEEQKHALAAAGSVDLWGTINDCDWLLVESKDSRDLPDYVLNPDRPEYN